MRVPFLLLSAASLLLAGASHAQAAGRDVETYLQHARDRAAQALAHDGAPVPQLTVRATVGGDGRLASVRVVRSSGSVETDQKAAQALRRLKVGEPPVELAGAEVTLPLGEAAAVQGSAP